MSDYYADSFSNRQTERERDQQRAKVRDRLDKLLSARAIDTAIIRELARRDLYQIAADALVARMDLDRYVPIGTIFTALADAPGHYLVVRLAYALRAIPNRHRAILPDVRALVADPATPIARIRLLRLAFALAGDPVTSWPRLPERERAALALGWLHRCMAGRS